MKERRKERLVGSEAEYLGSAWSICPECVGEKRRTFWPPALLPLRRFPPLAHSVHICHSILLIYFSLPRPCCFFPFFFSFFSLTLLSFFHLSRLLRLFRTVWTPMPSRTPCRLFITRVIHHMLLLVRNYFVCAPIKKSRRLSMTRVNYRSALRLTRWFLKSNWTDLYPQPSLFLLEVMCWRLAGNRGYAFLWPGYAPRNEKTTWIWAE